MNSKGNICSKDSPSRVTARISINGPQQKPLIVWLECSIRGEKEKKKNRKPRPWIPIQPKTLMSREIRRAFVCNCKLVSESKGNLFRIQIEEKR
jgi:hypothetical protein